MLREGSLVLYKQKPALVLSGGDKAEIRLGDGSSLKVREKDVVFLHAGPMKSFNAQAALDAAGEGDWETAWEMADGASLEAAALADLVFGKAGPEQVWAVMAHAFSDDGLFVPEAGGLKPLARSAIDSRRRKKAEREEAAALREGFVGRWKACARGGKVGPEPDAADARLFQEIEARALGSSASCRLLKELGLEDSPEAAHAFLLSSGTRDPSWNPWPSRSGLSRFAPEFLIPAPETAGRADLTGMEAFAIDNAWSHDPDDAISWDGERLWVHVADPSVSVEPGSPADLEARARSATLYLPEGAVPMLPDAALAQFGLGLAPLSPALSFGIRLGADGAVSEVELLPSMVRVTRHSYQSADALLDAGPLAALDALACANREGRMANGAVDIELPEIHLWVREGEPSIEPSPPSLSSGIVRECMLLAGEAAALYAFREGLPFPYYGQEAPAEGKPGEGLAGEWGKRKLMRPGMISGTPVAHRGLGLALYTQVTSPLRRYQDLLAHQQIRARLRGAAILSQDEIVESTGQAQAALSLMRRAERAAYDHWKCVWLMRRPEWRGRGVVVQGGKRAVVLIPELAMESQVMLGRDVLPNEELCLRCLGVDLSRLEARFAEV